MTFPFETVTATGDHGSITFRKSDGVVVARDFDSGFHNDEHAGYPFILWANPATLTGSDMDILHVGYYLQMPTNAVRYEPPIDMEEDLAPPLPKTEPKSMKPFDLEQAKAGAPVQTRDGHAARIICFDRKGNNLPVVALVTDPDGEEYTRVYPSNGGYLLTQESDLDLFMAPVKREGWVNIYRSAPGGAQDCYPQPLIFNTREEAIAAAYPSSLRATTRIEWEE